MGSLVAEGGVPVTVRAACALHAAPGREKYVPVISDVKYDSFFFTFLFYEGIIWQQEYMCFV